MSKSEQREWREGLLQGFLWTDVLDENGNAVARVRTHEMTRPYASEPTPEGMENLALVTQAPKLREALDWIVWEIEWGCADRDAILRVAQEAVKEAP